MKFNQRSPRSMHYAHEGGMQAATAGKQFAIETHPARIAVERGFRSLLPAAPIQVTVGLEPRRRRLGSAGQQQLRFAGGVETAGLTADIRAHFFRQRPEEGMDVRPAEFDFVIGLDAKITDTKAAI